MKVQIVDIRNEDAYTLHGFRDELIGRTGEFTVPRSVEKDEWTGGTFILDSPIEMEGKLTTELLFWRVKVKPVEDEKPVMKDAENDMEKDAENDMEKDAENDMENHTEWKNFFWTEDNYINVLFATQVVYFQEKERRYITITTILINNKRTGEIITHTGLAICNPKDTYDYITGKRLSVQRAIDTYPHKAQRKLLWGLYWKAVKNVSQE